MSGHVHKVTSLTIPSGQQASNILSADLRDADAVTFLCPATLPETVTVQYSDDEAAWFSLSAAGADVTLIAGKAIRLELPTTKALRLFAGAAVAADREIRVMKSVYVP